jgi:hypothetical protein
MALYVTRAWFTAARLHARYEELLQDRYCLVRFEDLIGDPEEQIQRVTAFLDVPFKPEMLEDISIVGSSYRSQRVISGVGFDQRATERWREHITPPAMAWFSILGRRQLPKFGYGL